MANTLFSGTAHEAASLSSDLNHYLKLQRLERKYDFCVPEGTGREILKNYGINLPPPKTSKRIPHPHSKALQLYTYNILSNIFPEPEVAAITTKSHNQGLNAIANNILTLKDVARFGYQDIARIPTEIPGKLVLDDCLQHLTFSQMAMFMDAQPQLIDVYCTLTVPPESLYSGQSEFPMLYTVKYSGNTMICAPDGEMAHAYSQPLSSRDWLIPGTIQTTLNTYRWGVIVSNADHHIVLFTRRRLLPEPASFSHGDTIFLPWIAQPFTSMGERRTSRTAVRKLLEYVNRNKALSKYDVYAKLSQFQMLELGHLDPVESANAIQYIISTGDFHFTSSPFLRCVYQLVFLITGFSWFSNLYSRYVVSSTWNAPHPLDIVRPQRRYFDENEKVAPLFTEIELDEDHVWTHNAGDSISVMINRIFFIATMIALPKILLGHLLQYLTEVGWIQILLTLKDWTRLQPSIFLFTMFATYLLTILYGRATLWQPLTDLKQSILGITRKLVITADYRPFVRLIFRLKPDAPTLFHTGYLILLPISILLPGMLNVDYSDHLHTRAFGWVMLRNLLIILPLQIAVAAEFFMESDMGRDLRAGGTLAAETFRAIYLHLALLVRYQKVWYLELWEFFKIIVNYIWSWLSQAYVTLRHGSQTVPACSFHHHVRCRVCNDTEYVLNYSACTCPTDEDRAEAARVAQEFVLPAETGTPQAPSLTPPGSPILGPQVAEEFVIQEDIQSLHEEVEEEIISTSAPSEVVIEVVAENQEDVAVPQAAADQIVNTVFLPISPECYSEARINFGAHIGEKDESEPSTHGDRMFHRGHQGRFSYEEMTEYFTKHRDTLLHFPDFGAVEALSAAMDVPAAEYEDRDRFFQDHHYHYGRLVQEGHDRSGFDALTPALHKELLEPTVTIRGPAGSAKTTLMEAFLKSLEPIDSILVISPTNSLLDKLRYWRELFPQHTFTFGSQHTLPIRRIDEEWVSYTLVILDECFMLPQVVVTTMATVCDLSVALGDLKQVGGVMKATETLGAITYRPGPGLQFELTHSFTVPQDVMTYLQDSRVYPRTYTTSSKIRRSIFSSEQDEGSDEYQHIAHSNAMRAAHPRAISINAAQGHRYDRTWFTNENNNDKVVEEHRVTLLTRHSEAFVCGSGQETLQALLPAVAHREVSNYPSAPNRDNTCVLDTIARITGIAFEEVLTTLISSEIVIRHRDSAIHLGDVHRVAELFQISLQPYDQPQAFPNPQRRPVTLVSIADGHMSMDLDRVTNLETLYLGTYHWPMGRLQGSCGVVQGQYMDTLGIPDVEELFECRNQEMPGFLPFLPSQQHALSFLSNFEQFHHHTADDYYTVHQLKSIVRACEPAEVELRCITGLPGSGKSYQVIQEHVANPEDSYICVPHESLRIETRRATREAGSGEYGYRYPTYVRMLTQNPAGHVVIDEATMLWKGALDALLISHPAITRVTLIYDPAQTLSMKSAPHDYAMEIEETKDRFAAFMGGYVSVTRRLARGVAETLGLVTSSEEEGNFILTKAAPLSIPLIAASPRYVDVLRGLGNTAYAVEECGGLTFDGDYAIDVNSLTKDVDNHVAFTMLTRGKRNVYLVVPQGPRMTFRSTILVSLLHSLGHRFGVAEALMTHPATWVHHHISSSLPAATRSLTNLPQEDLFIGSWDILREQVVNARDNILPRKRDMPAKITARTYAVRDRNAKLIYDQLHAKEERETSDLYGNMTNQIKETGTAQDIPAYMKATDRATVNISYDKRMRISSYEANKRDYEAGAAGGRQLFEAFQRVMKIPQAFYSEDVHERARAEAFATWASGRTTADFKRAANASHCDRSPLFTETFLKGGKVQKMATLNAKAKAGQIVTTFPLTAIMGEAPMAKHVENHIFKHCPDHILLNSGKTTEQIKEWYSRHWRQGETTASDYTAWDTGCDGKFLHFDVKIMELCGLPQWFIDGYVHRKLNTRMFKGLLTIMQLSGDRWTWLLNTLRNIALTSLRFKLTEHMAQAYAGDDMIMCGRADIDPRFKENSWKHRIKIERGSHNDFCGLEFGGKNITVNARQLLARIQIAHANTNTPLSTFKNYAVLASNYSAQDEWSNTMHRECVHILNKYCAFTNDN